MLAQHGVGLQSPSKPLPLVQLMHQLIPIFSHVGHKGVYNACVKKTLRQFKVWSNIFYLPTLLLALYWQLPVTVFFIVAVVVFGTLYHLSHERRWFLPDTLSAYLLIFSNLALCYEGGFKVPYFWIALMFVVLAFTYHYYLQQRGEYSFNHGMWHVYGSLITLFCIFTFVF